MPTSFARRVLGALAPHLLLPTGILCRVDECQSDGSEGRVLRDSRKHLERRAIEVSERNKGKDGLGRTWNPIQGRFDGFDVLSTGATSIFDGFELFDKLRTGWTSAVDEIHEG